MTFYRIKTKACFCFQIHSFSFFNAAQQLSKNNKNNDKIIFNLEFYFQSSTMFKTISNETNAYFCPIYNESTQNDCLLPLTIELTHVVGFLLFAYPGVWLILKLKIRKSVNLDG